MQRLSDLAQIDGLKVKIERWRQARPKSGSMPGGAVAGGRRCGEEIGYQSGSACAGARI